MVCRCKCASLLCTCGCVCMCVFVVVTRVREHRPNRFAVCGPVYRGTFIISVNKTHKIVGVKRSAVYNMLS